jgi:hypothetical protein
MDTREIAKGIREDIKAAIKAHELPPIRVSVSMARFAGGTSIDVVILTSAGILVVNPFRVAFDLAHPYGSSDSPPSLITERGEAMRSAVKAIVKAYQRDNSDPQTD